MQKLRKLKKITAIESAIFIAFILGIYAAYTLMDDALTQKQIEQEALQGEIRTIDGQIAEEERKVGIVKTSINEYNDLKETMESGGFLIDRNKAEEILNTLKTQYRLDKFSASISPETTVKGAGYDGRRIAEVTSEMRISFSAITDLQAFAFLQHLKESLPGTIRVTTFSMNREKSFTPSDLVNLSKGTLLTGVNANVTLLWLGLKVAEKPDPNAAPPPAEVGVGE